MGASPERPRSRARSTGSSQGDRRRFSSSSSRSSNALARFGADTGFRRLPPNRTPGRLKVTPWSVLPRDYGTFLCRVFDEWIKADVRTHLRAGFFDVQLGFLWAGEPIVWLCWFAETCGQGLALEHNGDLYACDHYVYPEYRLGNVREKSVGDMVFSPAQVKFGYAKSEYAAGALPAVRVPVRSAGASARKNRLLRTPDGEAGLNYLCPGSEAVLRARGAGRRRSWRRRHECRDRRRQRTISEVDEAVARVDVDPWRRNDRQRAGIEIVFHHRRTSRARSRRCRWSVAPAAWERRPRSQGRSRR